MGDDSGRVAALTLERTELIEQDGILRARGTGERHELACGLVLRSIGYRSKPIVGVPFDARRGVIANVDGRVVTADGAPLTGEYVAGWARRGASGVIGTNKEDAEQVVEQLLASLADSPRTEHFETEAIDALLDAKGVRRVDKHDGQTLRRAEARLGSRRGRRAVKFTSVSEMLAALDPE